MNENNGPPDLVLHMAPDAAHEWISLLRNGFTLRIDGPLSVRTFLAGPLDLREDYVRERVATVFLNGRPVDDMDEALVCAGDSLALAGSMPGIAGITMRRDSPVAAMRSQITSRGRQDCPEEAGRVTVRLFNNVAEEAGPDLLARGVEIEPEKLGDFLGSRDSAFWNGLERGEMSGKEIGSQGLAGFRPFEHPRPVRLRVLRRE
jgi:hypothetical protein